MSVAILVLGFKEPKVLAKVVEVYRRCNFDVYIHLDTKQTLSDYCDAMGLAAQYCKFISNRMSIFWGGYAMVLATIELIKAAKSVNDYSNYVLVSDDTLPLIGVEELKILLHENIDRISARKLNEDDPFYPRYKNFYAYDYRATSLRGRNIESGFIDDEFLSCIKRLEARKIAGKVPIDIYYGSQWWALTRQSINCILDIHYNRLDVRESFEFSAVPDEIYFQSLVANFSPFRNRTVGPVFVDWTKAIKPFVYSQIDELSEINTKYYPFARKVSSQHFVVVDHFTKE